MMRGDDDDDDDIDEEGEDEDDDDDRCVEDDDEDDEDVALAQHPSHRVRFQFLDTSNTDWEKVDQELFQEGLIHWGQCENCNDFGWAGLPCCRCKVMCTMFVRHLMGPLMTNPVQSVTPIVVLLLLQSTTRMILPFCLDDNAVVLIHVGI